MILGWGEGVLETREDTRLLLWLDLVLIFVDFSMVETIDLSEWSSTKVLHVDNMFELCHKLVSFRAVKHELGRLISLLA